MEESVAGPRVPGSRLGRAMPGVLFVLLVLAVWADPLLTRRNFAGRDLLAYNLPMEKAIHDAYAQGRFPIWVEEISGGRPLLPNPNAGALYPVRMLLALLPFPEAMRIFPLLHWAAAGLGVLVLLRSIGASRAGAFAGAVTYAFSGVAVSDVFFTHVLAGMALLPWIVWATRRQLPVAPKLFLLSLLLGLDMLAADVFTVGLAILCGCLWVWREEERGGRKRQFVVLAASVVLAALLALPQIVATALWIPETSRAVSGMKLQEVLLFSVSPYRLLELVVPYVFGPTWALEPASVWTLAVFRGKLLGLFVTLYAGALAVIGVVVTWRSPAKGARFARALIGVSLLLAVAPSLVPEAWLQGRSPLALRNPEKFSVALVLGLAVLAGLAVDVLRARRALPRWALAFGILLAAAAIAARLLPGEAGRAAVAMTGDDSAVFAPLAARALPAALAEAGILWMATLLAVGLLQSGRRTSVAAALAILAAVPIAANHRIASTLSEDAIFGEPSYVRFLRRHDPDGRYRVLGESLYRADSPSMWAFAASDPAYSEHVRRNWMEHGQVFWRRGTVFNGDFDTGDLSRIESARKVSSLAAQFTDGGLYFGNLSLRWGIRFRDQVALPGYRRVAGDGVQDWDENGDALPDIRFADSWTEVAGALEALERVSRARRGEVIVETGSQRSGTAPAGTVRVIERRPGRLVLDTDSPAPNWLFVLRGFWSHRTVRIDGVEAEVVPAQLAFSAVRVPAGRHRVDWVERIPGAEASRFGPVLYGLGIGLLFARKRAARRPA